MMMTRRGLLAAAASGLEGASLPRRRRRSARWSPQRPRRNGYAPARLQSRSERGRALEDGVPDAIGHRATDPCGHAMLQPHAAVPPAPTLASPRIGQTRARDSRTRVASEDRIAWAFDRDIGEHGVAGGALTVRYHDVQHLAVRSAPFSEPPPHKPAKRMRSAGELSSEVARRPRRSHPMLAPARSSPKSVDESGHACPRYLLLPLTVYTGRSGSCLCSQPWWRRRATLGCAGAACLWRRIASSI